MNKTQIRILLNNSHEDRTHYTIPRHWNLRVYLDVDGVIFTYQAKNSVFNITPIYE